MRESRFAFVLRRYEEPERTANLHTLYATQPCFGKMSSNATTNAITNANTANATTITISSTIATITIALLLGLPILPLALSTTTNYSNNVSNNVDFDADGLDISRMGCICIKLLNGEFSRLYN